MRPSGRIPTPNAPPRENATVLSQQATDEPASTERARRAAAALERWLGQVAEQHEDRVLPVDRSIAEEWGRMNVPDPLPVVEGLLAATARVSGLTLATRNTVDIERTGVRFVDPFLASP